jgi:hypothetical protein
MDHQQTLERLRVEARKEFEQRRKRDLATPRPKPPTRASRLGLLVSVLKVVALAVLPFAVLVRVSVYLYAHTTASPWLALGGGVAATVVVATAYGAWLSRKLTGRARTRLVLKWIALPLVVGYTGYALLYLSSANAKSEPVRAHFRSVHPVLRLALSTVVLADREIVVTDMAREIDDYRRMGLPPNTRSLHRQQVDGWVHAVDLRTSGRAEIKNLLVSFYFRAMGFATLRHVGTADHLHVALPPP